MYIIVNNQYIFQNHSSPLFSIAFQLRVYTHCIRLAELIQENAGIVLSLDMGKERPE